MCIEFVIQVLEQKNAHVSFPVGMVSGICEGMYRKIIWRNHELRYLRPSLSQRAFCRDRAFFLCVGNSRSIREQATSQGWASEGRGRAPTKIDISEVEKNHSRVFPS